MVFSSSSPAPDAEAVQEILLKLRRKQGTWVDWAQGCQTLQKARLTPQQIFEETGIEPIHQNQILVAAQVYQSILKVGLTEAAQAHFTERGSDALYELRVLSQADRASTAELILHHGLDSEEVRELVKPIKEYSYRKENPPGFGDGPGDAIAFHFWQLARQKDDLQDRSRLIAQGLRFAESAAARQQIEKLLTDFSVVKSRPAPLLPLYRLETESELPRIIPIVGQMPLTVDDLKAVPVAVSEEPFGLISFAGTGAWIAVPGWQVIFRAEDPVGLLTQAHQLPNYPAEGANEPVLVVVDRADRSWSDDSYFVTAEADHLTWAWSPSPLETPILGKVILILRPKRILDESYNQQPWQIDE
ncbi:MAG TPA: hypothetical protein IGR64_00825 [Leptolyngbyaceae cyanobacterium M65_K2018_010]|nr:hypothetical protein [Leptolyngbyaceae cyanobacterium M65_K2018_010]